MNGTHIDTAAMTDEQLEEHFDAIVDVLLFASQLFGHDGNVEPYDAQPTSHMDAFLADLDASYDDEVENGPCDCGCAY
jgi:hypothetical protein